MEGSSAITYFFEYQNKYYRVATTNQEDAQKGLSKKELDLAYNQGVFANQVQIQFNSLVTNKPNVTPKTISSNSTKSNAFLKSDKKLELKNASQLVKTDTNEPAYDSQTGKEVMMENRCILPNLEEYYYKSQNSYMKIVNKNDYTNDKGLSKLYDKFTTFLSNPNDKITDYMTKTFDTHCNSYEFGGKIKEFNTSNSGYEFEIYDLKMQKVEKFRIVITSMDIGLPVYFVNIYGEKGDNIFVISKDYTDRKLYEQYDKGYKKCIDDFRGKEIIDLLH
jgi:hypothetical protein